MSMHPTAVLQVTGLQLPLMGRKHDMQHNTPCGG
jgi:hypothetical protein